MATTTDTPAFCTMHWMANGSWSGSDTSYIVVLAPADERRGDVFGDTATVGSVRHVTRGFGTYSSFELVHHT